MANPRMQRLFDSMEEATYAFYDGVRSTNERAGRFSRAAVEEAQRTQQERLDLARRWAEAPMDVLGLTSAALDMWTRRQRRRIEMARGFFDEVSEMTGETRNAVQRVASANREAVRTGVRAGRAAASRARDEISERATQMREAASEAAEEAADAMRPSSDGAV
jgi:hypothetical protein